MHGTSLYLHGFASSPGSAKALVFSRILEHRGYPCAVPDLNVPSFRELTLSEVIATSARVASQSTGKLVLAGSSFGGLAAVHLLSSFPDIRARIDRVILIAPALDLPERWENRLTRAQFDEWRCTGLRRFPHHGTGKDEELGYQFVSDLEQYAGKLPEIAVPTLVVHGRRDEVIPIEGSRSFAERCASVRLQEFDTDHEMLDVLDAVEAAVGEFLR